MDIVTTSVGAGSPGTGKLTMAISTVATEVLTSYPYPNLAESPVLVALASGRAFDSALRAPCL
jgi:hypothetical protein